MKFYFKNIIFLLLSLSASLLSANELSKSDILDILKRNGSLNEKRANDMVTQLEKTYGTSLSGNLNISGVLVGSRWNYGFFKDRKEWIFDAAIKPKNSSQVVYVKNLVKAEFFNGGFKGKLLTKDCAFVFIPKGTSLKDLDGLETSRGLSFGTGVFYAFSVAFLPHALVVASLLLPLTFLGVDAGATSSPKGAVTFFIASAGAGYDLLTFPKFKFVINKDDDL